MYIIQTTEVPPFIFRVTKRHGDFLFQWKFSPWNSGLELQKKKFSSLLEAIQYSNQMAESVIVSPGKCLFDYYQTETQKPYSWCVRLAKCLDNNLFGYLFFDSKYLTFYPDTKVEELLNEYSK